MADAEKQEMIECKHCISEIREISPNEFIHFPSGMKYCSWLSDSEIAEPNG